MGNTRTRVSLLQFASNTIFFSRASTKDLQNLKLIHLFYRQISRLRINLDKSTISGINTSQD